MPGLHRVVLPLAFVCVIQAESYARELDPISPPIENPANGHTYILLEASNWFEARDRALDFGGTLVAINDAAEQQWVFDTCGEFGGIGRGLWIGLTDEREEGVFEWLTGEPFTYHNWADGEPNDLGGDQNYASVIASNSPFFEPTDAGLWDDEFGTRPFFGLVEITPDAPQYRPLVNTPRLAVFSGGGSTALFDPANWQGGAPPSLADPTVAIFDSTLEPINSLISISLGANATVGALGVVDPTVELDLQGNSLSVDGELSTDLIGLDIGLVRSDDSLLPPLPPTLRLDNTLPASVGQLVARRATVGRGGPGALAIGGQSRLRVLEQFVVGDVVTADLMPGQMLAESVISIEAPDASVFYGNPSAPPEGRRFIVGDRSSGRVTNSTGLLRSFGTVETMVLGDKIDGVGTVELLDGFWVHLGVDMIVGNSGSGLIDITGGGTLSTNLTGSLDIGKRPGSSGEVRLDADAAWTNTGVPVTLRPDGVITGSGTVVSTNGVRNAGTIEPDGTLTIEGPYIQSDDAGDIGTLRVAVGGSSTDVLDVTGDVMLAGELEVTAFDAQPRDRVTILTYSGSLTGEFDLSSFPTLPSDTFLTVSYGSTGGREEDTGGSVTLLVGSVNGGADFNGDPGGIAPPAVPSDAFIADIDNAGTDDLVLSVPDPDNPDTAIGNVVILFSGGNGIDGEWLGYTNSIAVPAGLDPQGVSVADLDGDGALDIAVANRASNDVTLIFQGVISQGTFATRDTQLVPAGEGPTDVTLADVDGDGIIDLAVPALIPADPLRSELRILFNNGPSGGGDVELNDLLAVLAEFGQGCP